jgi:hypothetical protein
MIAAKQETIAVAATTKTYVNRRVFFLPGLLAASKDELIYLDVRQT